MSYPYNPVFLLQLILFVLYFGILPDFIFYFLCNSVEFRILQNSLFSQNSVFHFFAEIPILFSIPFFCGKKWNFAKFHGIPYSFISIFLQNSVFHLLQQNSVKNIKRKQWSSGDFHAELLKNFDRIPFPYETKFGFLVQHKRNIT